MNNPSEEAVETQEPETPKTFVNLLGETLALEKDEDMLVFESLGCTEETQDELLVILTRPEIAYDDLGRVVAKSLRKYFWVRKADISDETRKAARPWRSGPLKIRGNAVIESAVERTKAKT